jgi:23S rRNA (guanosine2251-2'-O)-methyltransferase
MTEIVGIHSVNLALAAGSGIQLRIRQGKLNRRQEAIIGLAEQMGCPVVFEAIEGDEIAHQGVALEVVPPRFQTEQELGSLLKVARDNWLFLILDGVTDPRNFGACLRSAASFGVHGVIVPKDHAAPLNDAAIKTASGGASLTRVFQVVNLARTIDSLKKAGIWIVGTLPEDSEPLPKIDLKGNIALVMGAEDVGLRQKTQDRCDFLAHIPMDYADLSLNVSVAAGICLYEVQKQRSA